MSAIPSPLNAERVEPSAEIDSYLRTALRIVLFGMLVSLLWKVNHFIQGYVIYSVLPLEDPFFPAIFRSEKLFAGSYVVCLVCLVLAMFFVQRTRILTMCLIASVSLFVLMVHQQTYNDVTFLTSFWCSLWCTWFVYSARKEPANELMPKAAFVAHFIVGTIFLGGAVGKYTQGYWSGEILHGIYFEGRDFWSYNFIRSMLADSALPEISKWHSRIVIVSETCAAFIWLLPARSASILGIVMLLGIALTNNFYLISVVGCLVALSATGLVRR